MADPERWPLSTRPALPLPLPLPRPLPRPSFGPQLSSSAWSNAPPSLPVLADVQIDRMSTSQNTSQLIQSCNPPLNTPCPLPDMSASSDLPSNSTFDPHRHESMRAWLPPSAVRNAVVVQDPPQFFNARFLVDDQVPASARTALHLGPDPNQRWSPLDARNVRFITRTPTDMDKKRGHNERGKPSSANKRVRVTASAKPARKKGVKANRPRLDKVQLRTNKPLKNSEDVHMDVWRLILKYSKPGFLLNAKTINRRFYALLQEESIWLESRINHYGKDMPGPPGNMSEQRYATLLEGKGCQSINCAKTNTGKIFWAFQIRLCETCLMQKTMREEEIERYRFQELSQQKLLNLLPAGIVDSGKYSRSRQINSQTGDWENMSAGPMFLKSDLEAIESEYEELLLTATTAEIGDWMVDKRTKVEEVMAQIAKVETWFKVHGVKAPRHRRDREIFFRDQAAKLSPPMHDGVLNKMMAYKMSLDANTPATEKSWKLLKEKILPYRSAAERLVDCDRQMNLHVINSVVSPEINTFIQLRMHRSVRNQTPKSFVPEQVVVIDMAMKTLAKHREAADADLVLLVLRDVYQDFQVPAIRPRGLNTNGLSGPYTLSLDDARMIIEEIIEPEVRSWNDSRRTSIALERFKCSGCPRTDCTTRYSFVKGFEHIRTRHAKYVGDDLEYHTLARPFHWHGSDHFPWYTVEWPRNLPLVAAHHLVKRDEKWKPDAIVDYVRAPRPGLVSAFTNRRASANSSIGADDFGGNLVYAAAQLFPTTLSSTCQTRIALQYALDRYAQTHGMRKPPLDDFIVSMKAIQSANSRIDFRYRCGACTRQTNVPRTTKFIKAPVQFHELEEHWNKKHALLDWTVDLMDLPTGTQVRDQIEDGDRELKERKEDIEATERARKATAKKKPSAKAPVVLNTPEAMGVFDTLYTRR